MNESLRCFERATLRRADSNDIDLYFEWLNCPELMRVSGRSKQVSYEDHQQWFMNNLNSSSVLLYILLDSEENIVGQVSFKRVSEEWSVGFHVLPAFRSKGWGYYLIESGLRALHLHDPMARNVHAFVRLGNESSERVLIGSNFRMARSSIWMSGSEFKRFDYEIDAIESF